VSSIRAYKWTAAFYQTFLGLWFGALVMLAVAAAITFATVRGMYPQWPVDQQNMLAGGIVGNLIRNGLTTIQVLCAVVVAVCTILQCTVFRDRIAKGWLNWLRVLLILLPIVILAYDQSCNTPRMLELRERMFDQSSPDRNVARQEFARRHELAEQLTGTATFLIGGALLVSSFVLIPGRTDEQDSG